MSRHLRATSEYMEKVAYGGGATGITGALAKAVEQNPWAALTIGGLTFAGAQGLAGKAFSTATQPIDTTSYEINKFLRPGIGGAMTRIRADEIMANQLLKTFSNLGDSAIEGAVNMVSKAHRKSSLAPKQKRILEDLLANDEVISQASPEAVSSVYSSMLEAAPTIAAKHKESVRSFLRQGLAHEGGIDPMTIGQLARAEAAVRGKNLSNLN